MFTYALADNENDIFISALTLAKYFGPDIRSTGYAALDTEEFIVKSVCIL